MHKKHKQHHCLSIKQGISSSADVYQPMNLMVELNIAFVMGLSRSTVHASVLILLLLPRLCSFLHAAGSLILLASTPKLGSLSL